MHSIDSLFNQMLLGTADPKLVFPKGLRYTYYAAKVKRKQTWHCSYSTTRNKNNKFVSFVHVLQKKNWWKLTRVVEHKRRKDAKARAIKLYYSRTKQQKEN